MDPAERLYLELGLVLLSIFVFVILALCEKAKSEEIAPRRKTPTLYDALCRGRKQKEERIPSRCEHPTCCEYIEECSCNK